MPRPCPPLCSSALPRPSTVYGLYTGISLGPLIQAVLYGALLLRVDWEKEALVAARRAQEDDS